MRSKLSFTSLSTLTIPSVLLLANTCLAQVEQPPVTPASNATPSLADQVKKERRRKRRLPLIGPEVEGIYLLDSKTRELFGSTLFNIGPGFGSITPSVKGKWGPDFSLVQAEKRIAGDKNKLFLLMVGPEYRRALTPSKFRQRSKEESDTSSTDNPPKLPRFMPYYGASLNLLYAKVEIPGAQIDGSGFGVGGSALVGVTIKERAFLETRFRATTNVKELNFSGVSLTVGIRF